VPVARLNSTTFDVGAGRNVENNEDLDNGVMDIKALKES
jgi:hypothetical protein